MQSYSTAKHRAFIACYIAMSISLVFMYIFKSSFSFLLESIDVKNMLKTYQNVADFYNISITFYSIDKYKYHVSI